MSLNSYVLPCTSREQTTIGTIVITHPCREQGDHTEHRCKWCGKRWN